MKKIFLLITFFSFLSSKNANAQLFNVTATRTGTGQTVSASFDSAQKALDYFQGQNLNNAFGTNVDGEAVSIALNYRGLNSTLTYDTSSNLNLVIPGIVNKTFNGGNRDASVELLKDYLKSEGGDILDRINKRLAAVSPSDPIAGNPISLMSQMVDDDFELAFTDALHDGNVSDGAPGNEMGSSAQYSRYNVSGIDSQVYSVSPFSWRRNLGNSDAKFLLKLPVVKMIKTEGATTYQASGSVGFSIPLVKNYWSIVPMASIGAVGSEDLASAAAMRGLSLTNRLGYNWENGWGVHLGTLYGNYKTEKLEVNDYKSNPNIQNAILKNSLVATIPLTNRDFVMDASITNTRFYGTELYIENAMDYGIAFVKTSRTDNNEIRLDLKYYSYDSQSIATIGNGKRGVSGFSANLKFQY